MIRTLASTMTKTTTRLNHKTVTMIKTLASTMTKTMTMFYEHNIALNNYYKLQHSVHSNCFKITSESQIQS